MTLIFINPLAANSVDMTSELPLSVEC